MAFVTMIFPRTTYRVASRELFKVVICRNQRLTVFHQWKMDYFRQAANRDFKECMELYPDEMPWIIPEIRRWYHRAPP